MESVSVTPVKESCRKIRSGKKEKQPKSCSSSENSNPNVSKLSGSPSVKSATKPQNSASKMGNAVFNSPKNKIRERKFVVVAKRKGKKPNEENEVSVACKCNASKDGKKCLCVAYESLRASQEEFFKNKKEEAEEGEIEKKLMIEDLHTEGTVAGSEDVSVSEVKRSRDRLIEEVRKSVPEAGSGKVKSLVKEFEKLWSADLENKKKQEVEPVKLEIPGLGLFPEKGELRGFSSEFCPPDGPELVLTSQSLGLNSVSASWDSNRGSFSSRASSGSCRNRRHSTDSTGAKAGRRRVRKKQPKATSLKPFQLRTEERGKMKEEEFKKKLEELRKEEERQRIPVAQGLPWTTDEPAHLIKPPVKEITIPDDLMLHTDVRAVERAEFDHQVAEKMLLIEQYKEERERQRKLAEEEEIRRLRKELVPKAQPLPYFDRPFIPKRSTKVPTMPREPKFHIPEHKKIKCCLSRNDSFSFYE